MAMRKFILFATILASSAAQAKNGRSVQPLAPGQYCLRQHLSGFTGTGQDIDLGDFLMTVEVTVDRGRYAVEIANQMPDNPQILEASTDNATLMRDGSLSFRFTDEWDNQGKARLYPDGKTVLVMTKRAPMNQIERNYGTFTVSQSNCAGVEFR